MKLDDLARRAADEVREAGREARYTVRPPGSRPTWARSAAAFGAAAVILAVGMALLLLYGPWVKPVSEVPVTTTAVTTTTPEAATSTAAGSGKTPAATVDELVTAYYAAGNADDWDAFRALNTDDCMHAIYLVQGKTGQIADFIAHADYDFAGDPLQRIDVLGASVVSGDVVAVPVRWIYGADGLGAAPGIDVLVVRHVEGGLLVGAVATFINDDRPGLVVDPADARALIEASAAAFNADDVEGVLATMAGSTVLWEDMTVVATTHTTGGLRAALADASLLYTVEYTGEQLASGQFFAVPSRHTDEATGLTHDGMYIYWISDEKIALQAYAQGA